MARVVAFNPAFATGVGHRLAVLALAMLAGCVRDHSASLSAVQTLRPGDTEARVTSEAGVWPRHLFLTRCADGRVLQCLVYDVAAGDRQPVPLAYVFRDEHLWKTVALPSDLDSYSSPAPGHTSIRDYGGQTALIDRLLSESALTSGAQRQWVNSQRIFPPDPPELRAIEGFVTVLEYTVVLPPYLIANAVVTARYNHWNPNRLRLGALVEDADDTFGRPLEVSTDAVGRELRLYGVDASSAASIAPPLVVTFVQGRAVRIVSEHLAVRDPLIH